MDWKILTFITLCFIFIDFIFAIGFYNIFKKLKKAEQIQVVVLTFVTNFLYFLIPTWSENAVKAIPLSSMLFA